MAAFCIGSTIDLTWKHQILKYLQCDTKAFWVFFFFVYKPAIFDHRCFVWHYIRPENTSQSIQCIFLRGVFWVNVFALPRRKLSINTDALIVNLGIIKSYQNTRLVNLTRYSTSKNIVTCSFTMILSKPYSNCYHELCENLLCRKTMRILFNVLFDDNGGVGSAVR